MEVNERQERHFDEEVLTKELEIARQEVYDAIALGEQDIAEGKCVDLDTAMKEIFQMIRARN